MGKAIFYTAQALTLQPASQPTDRPTQILQITHLFQFVFFLFLAAPQIIQ